MSTTALSPRTTHFAGTDGERSSSPAVQRLAEMGRRWLGVELSVMDARQGELLWRGADQFHRDWDYLGQCAATAARLGRVEFLDEEAPVVALALPLPSEAGSEGGLVGVGMFVLRDGDGEPSASRCARMLGLSEEEALAWLERQTPWAADALERSAALLVEHLRTVQANDRLRRENESLGEHISLLYEELCLLHRLTQNLKISSDEAELAPLVLGWLADAVAAEGLCLLWTRQDDAGPTAPPRPALVSTGHCPLDAEAMAALLEQLKLRPTGSPFVGNHLAEQPDWPWPEVQQIAAAPIADGDQLFGWLIAINVPDGEEFGTTEASLLSSVATLLGIHAANLDLYRQQSDLLAGVIRALTSAIDAKDPYTCGHSDRVARISVRLGQELGLDHEKLRTIYLGGLLHDIGKIGVNDAVLRKPGKLTPIEFEHIKQHVIIGHHILSDLKQLEPMLPLVKHHHESWDGSGYPDGLAGEAIPYLARIVAVADAFDAMASDRPYRRGMDTEQLSMILKLGAGKQWDPEVIGAFFRAFDEITAIVRTARAPQEMHPEIPLWT